MSERREDIIADELRIQLDLFQKSVGKLSASYERCRKIGVRDDYSDDEQIEFEALTARFARVSDIFMQKILGLLDALELEERGTIIDRINRAEKRGIISSSNTFKEIREIRNEISHEYVDKNLAPLFRKVMDLTPTLIGSHNSLESYCRRYFSQR